MGEGLSFLRGSRKDGKEPQRIPIKRLFKILHLVFQIFLLLALSGESYYLVKLINEKEALESSNESIKSSIPELYAQIESLKAQVVSLSDLSSKIQKKIGFEETLTQGVGGPSLPEKIKDHFKLKEDKLLKELQLDIEALESKAKIEDYKYSRLNEFLEQKARFSNSIPSIRPIKGGWITSGFYYRIDPFTGEWKMHSGVDISHSFKAPVLATADGVVISTGYDRAYGKFIEIDHGNGFMTFYAHLSEILVVKGQKVTKGKVIGKLGRSGRTTGQHLHYEVRFEGRNINPVRFFPN